MADLNLLQIIKYLSLALQKYRLKCMQDDRVTQSMKIAPKSHGPFSSYTLRITKLTNPKQKYESRTISNYWIL